MPVAALPSAAQAFAQTARAMHAAIAAMPSRVSYDVRTDVRAYGRGEYRYHYEEDRAAGTVTVRVDAGTAPPTAAAWPIDPIFDPFARFATAGQWRPIGRQDGTFANEPRPMTFDMTKRPGVDTMALSVNGYVVRYADAQPPGSDAIALRFEPTRDALRSQTVFLSATVDTTTWLPLRITMRTPVGHSDVELDYAQIGGHPVLTHFRLARGPFATEAWFENVRFDAAP